MGAGRPRPLRWLRARAVGNQNTNGRRNADRSVGANCTNEQADEYSGRYY